MTRVLLMCALICTFAGCQSVSLDAKAIKPAVDKIAARHDEYVRKDTKLSDVEKEVHLLTSKNLRATVDAAAKDTK